MGINSASIDWRLYGVSLIIKSESLQLHKDKLNCTMENYNMAVTFSAVLPITKLEENLRNKMIKKCANAHSEILNITIVVYGRQQLYSLQEKLILRATICKENTVVNAIIQKLMKDNSWGYESWLQGEAMDEIDSWINLIHTNGDMDEILSFDSSRNQSASIQLEENLLFKKSYFVKKSCMTNQLYWSSFATAYYRMNKKYTLSQYQRLELILFTSTEVNGQCLASQMFFWHVLSLAPSELNKYINEFGTLYLYLSHLFVNIINR